MVLRGENQRTEVLLVHRPRYDDWSLPKGKRDPGEMLARCAVREVAEETGIRVRLQVPLDRTRYRVGKMAKQVDWWLAEPLGEVPADFGDEIDDVRWVALEEAYAIMSYHGEVATVRQGAEQPETTAFLLTRHAKAMDRKRWSGNDCNRPLTRAGRTQSRELIAVLDSYGVERVWSSTSSRCGNTVTPYAEARHLEVHREPLLSEERGVDHQDDVFAWVSDLRRRVATDGMVTVVSAHRPVMPAMLAALDLPERTLKTAESAVVSLTRDNRVHSIEWVRVLRGD